MHRWHDQGGWSQARFQRGIQKETKDHVKHAGEELFKLFKRGVAQRLIIGCPDEMRGEVENTLHSYLRERIAGKLDIDVKANSRRGRARGGRDHRARRARARAPLARPPAERGWGATTARRRGLADTLEALNEQRVEALLVPTASAPRATCRRGPTSFPRRPGESPTGEELQRRDDVIESAMERALEQSAEVVVVRHHPDLEALGSIAAVLRF